VTDIEYDPPDEPGLRGRITVLREPVEPPPATKRKGDELGTRPKVH
jgi:hypothetical protein